MIRKELRRLFWKFAGVYVIGFLLLSTLSFILLNTKWFPIFPRSNESIAYNFIRAFDKIPIVLLYLPFLKKEMYNSTINSLLELQDLTLAEYVERCQLDKSYVKRKKGKLVIRFAKQGEVLDFMENHLPSELLEDP
ncbi:hypothetical protein JZO70_05935 [Enterococcus sp. 669A]|uniref:Uncharacterized protein n=1 Tax=Candidatus Enterococcus moelleringii TaxID=2815325 RepID=A0ABS3L9E1_9ENTE|nr:hypothetical protein [Enterococcus sp. 669A]MBO1305688.1 hypothetical protein [Enterococcus sp. 669A]